MLDSIQDASFDSVLSGDYSQTSKETSLADDFEKYNILLSFFWSKRLPVFTKSGKLSFSRKGYDNGKPKTKSNPLWSTIYSDFNTIKLDNPNKLSLDDILSMNTNDWKVPGFWANPYSLEFKPDIPSTESRAWHYYKWLNRTPEGAKRLCALPKLKFYYLISFDLLERPLYTPTDVYHYGQLLAVLRWQSYGLLLATGQLDFTFVSEEENNIVSYNPSLIQQILFYCRQMEISFSELLEIYKKSNLPEMVEYICNLKCHPWEIPL